MPPDHQETADLPTREQRRGDAMAAPAAPTPSSLRAPAPRQRVGQYEILEVLGEGGFGAVYLAAQANPQRQVAVKVLRSDVVSRSFRGDLEAIALKALEKDKARRYQKRGGSL